MFWTCPIVAGIGQIVAEGIVRMSAQTAERGTALHPTSSGGHLGQVSVIIEDIFDGIDRWPAGHPPSHRLLLPT